jgi:lipopolysaccharide export system ATP-binding protein
MSDSNDSGFGDSWLIKPTVAKDPEPEVIHVPAMQYPSPPPVAEAIQPPEAPRGHAVEQSVVVTLTRPEPVAPKKPVLVAKQSGLSVRNLGKQYAKRPVVRNVSLDVQRGEAVGLLGPNGAGKTTCFYMITGLVAPDYGTISLDGTDITELPMYRRARLGIGYLPQETSIFRGLTVEQNIMAVLEVSEPDPQTRRAMLDELLAEFSITHLRSSPSVALSGGERRRAEIARALAGRPAFILLDEPLAGIDPIAIAEVRDLVKHLKDRGIGVLITDHNVRETLDVIDRAYIIHDGTVLFEGIPNDIVNNDDVRRVYLGEKFSL